MQKTILITGATDGIGLVTAKQLTGDGHNVLVHGRDASKLATTAEQLSFLAGGRVDTFQADLTNLKEVQALCSAVQARTPKLDVIINNAGVFKTPTTITTDGLDTRFVVNTIAPYLLTHILLPTLAADGRVVNLSSAAQAPVNIDALQGSVKLDDMAAYSQSKLAITSWTRSIALNAELETDLQQVFVAVNPGSLLATKMVKEAFNNDGRDINIGADILVRAALSEEFATASGSYFDNDSGVFASPHPDAVYPEKMRLLLDAIDSILKKLI